MIREGGKKKEKERETEEENNENGNSLYPKWHIRNDISSFIPYAIFFLNIDQPHYNMKESEYKSLNTRRQGTSGGFLKLYKIIPF